MQGLGCAREDRPGVYARVSAVSDWIYQEICRMSDRPPPACDEATVPRGVLNQIRIDFSYSSASELASWTLFDSFGAQVAGSNAGSVLHDGILVSTYVDVEVGTYFINVDNLLGEFKVYVLVGDGTDRLLAQGSDSRSFLLKERSFDPTPSIKTDEPSWSPAEIASSRPNPTVVGTNSPLSVPIQGWNERFTGITTVFPSMSPNMNVQTNPSHFPTINPTNNPTLAPITFEPSHPETDTPTTHPTIHPTIGLTVRVTSYPTNDPTLEPTVTLTPHPTSHYSPQLTVRPTSYQTSDFILEPTVTPTA
jgi:hypothetical protein